MAFLKPEDYIIFAITLAFPLGIGLYYSLRGTKQNTTGQFILGDGNMASFPVALSLMVSFESGIMMLGVPAEVYMYGMQWYMSIIGGFFAHMLTLHLVIPLQRKLNITSMNQYFELRYNSHGLRLFATILGLLSSLNYLGSVLFVPAVTLEMVAGIPMWISIITLTVVVLVYTIIIFKSSNYYELQYRMAFLKPEDYIIFAITLAFSLGIGLYYSLRGNKQKTPRQFILGDGNMASFPVALSLMVSFESGIMMLGVPAEVYMYGMQWYMSIIGGFFAHMLTLHLIIPLQRKLNITSMNQYYELRYNSHGLRLFATILGLLSSVNYLGSVLFVPAVTLEMVAGIPVWISIITLTVVVLIYIIIGGFTAIIWTDVFQAVLMFGGMIAILIKGTMESGGVFATWSIVKEKGRFNMLDFNPDPTLRQSFWSLFVGSLISGTRLQFSQATFQRVKATPTLSTARRMFFIASILFLIISALAVMEGAVMFAYYHTKGCDPLESKQVRNQNQLIAKMVLDIFHDTPCLPGLFLAALFSASLSTMSSVLSAMSAWFWEDIVKPHTKPMSDKRAIRIAQLSVLLFGVLTIFAAFGISGIDGPISRILDITSACMSGAINGIMVLGWFFPAANSLGALVGGLVSFLVVGWISIGKLVSSGVRVHAKLEPASSVHCPLFNVSGFANATINEHMYSGTLWNSTNSLVEAPKESIASGPQGLDILYSLSYKWLFPIAVCLVFIVGSIVSRLQARKPVDHSLVVPVCDNLCCCIPEQIRRKFRCGVKYPSTDNELVEDEAQSMVEMTSTPENNQEAVVKNILC